MALTHLKWHCEELLNCFPVAFMAGPTLSKNVAVVETAGTATVGLPGKNKFPLLHPYPVRFIQREKKE